MPRKKKQQPVQAQSPTKLARPALLASQKQTVIVKIERPAPRKKRAKKKQPAAPMRAIDVFRGVGQPVQVFTTIQQTPAAGSNENYSRRIDDLTAAVNMLYNQRQEQADLAMYQPAMQPQFDPIRVFSSPVDQYAAPPAPNDITMLSEEGKPEVPANDVTSATMLTATPAPLSYTMPVDTATPAVKTPTTSSLGASSIKPKLLEDMFTPEDQLAIRDANQVLASIGSSSSVKPLKQVQAKLPFSSVKKSSSPIIEEVPSPEKELQPPPGLTRGSPTNTTDTAGPSIMYPERAALPTGQEIVSNAQRYLLELNPDQVRSIYTNSSKTVQNNMKKIITNYLVETGQLAPEFNQKGNRPEIRQLIRVLKGEITLNPNTIGSTPSPEQQKRKPDARSTDRRTQKVAKKKALNLL